MAVDPELSEKVALAIYSASSPWSMMTVSEARKLADVAVQIISPVIRKEERSRAAKIVKNWEVRTNHIVSKMRVEQRKDDISEAIIWGS
ncbi:MAG: hypothetical protein EB015_14735 [Methylocystaceae bacterium]|nr:hypothetical protein [Methylocystaceae bacterium]